MGNHFKTHSLFLNVWLFDVLSLFFACFKTCLAFATVHFNLACLSKNDLRGCLSLYLEQSTIHLPSKRNIMFPNSVYCNRCEKSNASGTMIHFHPVYCVVSQLLLLLLRSQYISVHQQMNPNLLLILSDKTHSLMALLWYHRAPQSPATALCRHAQSRISYSRHSNPHDCLKARRPHGIGPSWLRCHGPKRQLRPRLRVPSRDGDEYWKGIDIGLLNEFIVYLQNELTPDKHMHKNKSDDYSRFNRQYSRSKWCDVRTLKFQVPTLRLICRHASVSNSEQLLSLSLCWAQRFSVQFLCALNYAVNRYQKVNNHCSYQGYPHKPICLQECLAQHVCWD